MDDSERATFERHWTRAKEAWPDVGMEQTDFFEALELGVAQAPDRAQALEGVQAADVYLASACARGDARALRLLDAHFLSPIVRAVARAHRMDAAELESDVREQVLVRREERPPRIAAYAGRGSLRGWLQVAASRVALNKYRGRQEVPVEQAVLEQMEEVGDDPALRQLKLRYRSEFATAFAEAFAALPARDRTLLRQHYIDALTGDEMAGLYRVHRATAVRWLAAARAALFAATRQQMAQRLSLSEGAFPSILKLIRSELRLSLGALGTGASGEQ
jgi:RNA polymerase sigma-70 factor (ECF subfamily)